MRDELVPPPLYTTMATLVTRSGKPVSLATCGICGALVVATSNSYASHNTWHALVARTYERRF